MKIGGILIAVFGISLGEYIHLDLDYNEEGFPLLKHHPSSESPNSADCAAKCEAFPGCKRWVYGGPAFSVALHRGCYLKGNQGGLKEIAEKGVVTGYHSTEAQPEYPNFAIAYNIDYSHSDIDNFAVSKWQDCGKACAESKACEVFAFRASDNQCYRKTAGALNHRMLQNGFVSGIKVGCTDFQTFPNHLINEDVLTVHTTSATGALACRSKCLLTIGCKLAEWNDTTKACRLASDPDNNPNAVTPSNHGGTTVFKVQN